MDIPENKNSKVGAYFDSISGDYRERYGPQNPFHAYFFGERLIAATDGIPFEGKTVLDVGAGTGALYDHLRKNPGLDYYACDISPNMLSQSSIPPSRSFVGRASDIRFPKDKFDYIFLLGVTTYQTPAELNDTLQFIEDRLALGGMAIVSFTNSSSIDYVLRGLLRLARPFIRKGILGQSFATYAYRLGSVTDLSAVHNFHVSRTVYLNQTFSPFNTMLPRASVLVARWLGRNCPNFLLPLCSADFMIFMERKPAKS
jgi:SAM-dependent methyltransferase